MAEANSVTDLETNGTNPLARLRKGVQRNRETSAPHFHLTSNDLLASNLELAAAHSIGATPIDSEIRVAPVWKMHLSSVSANLRRHT